MSKKPTTVDREALRLALLTGADVAVDSEITLAMLDAAGNRTSLTKAERAAALQRLRAGEVLVLEAEITAFLQRATANRNFVRVKPGALPSLSASFRGVPFLRDHRQRDLDARGGTVIDSKLEHGADGTKVMRHTLRLVKPWAVEGFLDGTIDRFSIGLFPTGPVLCSLDEKPLWGPGCCEHWPGDVVGDQVCEVLYTAAEGVECSAVNVPAVVGTGIDAVRSLKAEFDGTAMLAGILTSHPQEPPTMDITKILAALGLPATATPEQAETKARELAAALATAQAEDGLQRARLAQAESTLTELTARVSSSDSATRKLKVDGAIAALYGARKLQVVLGGTNPVETYLRKLADSDLELFTARCAEVAAGPTLQPGNEQPPPPPPGDGGGDRGSALEAERWLKKAGLSQAQIDKYGRRHLDGLGR